MQIDKAVNENSMYGMVADEIEALLREKKDAVLCLAAGNTSIGLFRELIERERNGRLDFTGVRLAGLDEWLGKDIDGTENCYGFLERHLLSRISIDRENCVFFRGDTKDAGKEIERMARFLAENGGIDYMLLGLGMNGHLGLNEPGTSFSEHIHTVSIDEITGKTAQKYFSAPASLDRGITLGPQDILEARRVVLMVQGKHKKEILGQLLESGITEALPASLLKLHTNAWIIADTEALS